MTRDPFRTRSSTRLIALGAMFALVAACSPAAPGPGTPAPPSVAPSEAPSVAMFQQPQGASASSGPTASAGPTTATGSSGGYQLVGYFPEWGVDQGPYRVKEVEAHGAADRLTVLDYAFAVPRPAADGTVTCQVADPNAAYVAAYTAAASVDGDADAAGQPLRGHFNQLRKLKARHPGLRVVMSIGGWTDSTWFSDAARTAASRKAFVASCIDLYIRGDLPAADGAGGPGVAAGIFDGFDIDWEYPVDGGDTGIHHDPNDTANLAALVAEFRAQLAAVKPDALLTMAVPTDRGTVDGYGVATLASSLDWFNLMTYDLHGSWDDSTAHHTNLCPTGEAGSSGAETVSLYEQAYGVPPAKLVLGAAFYGNGWKGVRSTGHGLGQPASGAAAGRYEEGVQNYRDLAALTAHGFTRYWDATAKAPWLYSAASKVFWTYDDAESLAFKASFVRAHGLGGAMFWELSGDDDAGTLIRALGDGLASSAPAVDPCA